MAATSSSNISPETFFLLAVGVGALVAKVPRGQTHGLGQMRSRDTSVCEGMKRVRACTRALADSLFLHQESGRFADVTVQGTTQ